MTGPADFIFPLIWRFFPQKMREEFAIQALAFQARTGINVPVSEVQVFKTRSNKQNAAEAPADVALPPYSLLCTCYNEKAGIEKFLDSVLSQRHQPVELIIVDGGSSDGTPQMIENWKKTRGAQREGGLPFETKVIAGERRNIAQGRNCAARTASCEIFAFADAGCELDRFWAERLLEPFAKNPGTEVSMGYYKAVTNGEFEHAVSTFVVPQPGAIDPSTFLPSGRSLAITKDAFAATGGYPEFLTLAGEDSLFDYYLKSSAERFAFVPDALAFWHFPHGVKMFSTIRNYARGDAEGGKLFWLYYNNLLRSLGMVVFELVLYFVMDLWFAVTGFKLFRWASLIFGASAIIRYFVMVFKYQPLRRGGLFSKEGATDFFAVQLMAVAQGVGFVLGLNSRPKVERRRLELAKAGHLVLFSPQASKRGENSADSAKLKELLAAGYLISQICAAYTKEPGEVFFEHQFLDVYLRSGFDLDAWAKKFVPLHEKSGRQLYVLDLCKDALSSDAAAKILMKGGKLLES